MFATMAGSSLSENDREYAVNHRRKQLIKLKDLLGLAAFRSRKLRDISSIELFCD